MSTVNYLQLPKTNVEGGSRNKDSDNGAPRTGVGEQGTDGPANHDRKGTRVVPMSAPSREASEKDEVEG